jgi:hypothetical protein
MLNIEFDRHDYVEDKNLDIETRKKLIILAKLLL